jgi:hypothetical protein
MRTLIVATLFALGLGLVGVTGSSAAPTNYTAIPQTAQSTNGSNLLQKIWWNRYGQWCSRRCNWRRCFIVCR